MNSSLQQPFVFVDLETTGGSHFNSRVLEVGVVRVENCQVVAEYQTLVHPGEAIPPFITGLTGITNDQVADSPRFETVATDLAELLDGAVFVAHNVRFDYSFLKMEFERIGVPFRPQMLCTVRLSRRLFPQFRTHKLGDLISRHGLIAPARHRAFDDAHCLWQFYQLCMQEFDLDTIEEALKVQLKAQSIPSQLDQGQVAALPEGPGVYIFEDESGYPLYVGKSVNVKRRVMSHFTSDYERSAEQKMASRVKCLRGIPTHGELGALLLESDLIKELQPAYNRMLRNRQKVAIVTAVKTSEGFSSVDIRDVETISPEDAADLLVVYTTQARARQSLDALVRKYRLCPKLMGLERTNKACFLSQLGKCAGVCDGRESAGDYNERFAAAFERQRIATWPFAGPVLIREKCHEILGSTGYVVNNWCLAMKMTELEDGTVESSATNNGFDVDQYRIIRRYLENPSNKHRTTPLSPDQMRQLVTAAVEYD